MKLTRKEILQAFAGIKSLADAAKDGKLVLGAKPRYTVSKNYRILKGLFEDVDSARESLIKKIAPAAQEIKPGTPEMAEFSAQWKEFLAESEEVEGLLLLRLNTDLKFETNDIHPQILCDLGQLLIDEQPA